VAQAYTRKGKEGVYGEGTNCSKKTNVEGDATSNTKKSTGEKNKRNSGKK